MYFFDVLLLTCVVYGLWRGGAPERCVVLIIIAASVLTVLAQRPLTIRYRYPELPLMLVDTVMLIALAWVALMANREWPTFTAGMQAAAVCVHVARLMQPGMLPFGYALGAQIWSFPILCSVILGTFVHRRQIAARLHDKPWSRSWRWWIPAPLPPGWKA